LKINTKWIRQKHGRNAKDMKRGMRDLTPHLDEMQKRNQAQAIESKLPKTVKN
jgi:hypothetical protein